MPDPVDEIAEQIRELLRWRAELNRRLAQKTDELQRRIGETPEEKAAWIRRVNRGKLGVVVVALWVVKHPLQATTVAAIAGVVTFGGVVQPWAGEEPPLPGRPPATSPAPPPTPSPTATPTPTPTQTPQAGPPVPAQPSPRQPDGERDGTQPEAGRERGQEDIEDGGQVSEPAQPATPPGPPNDGDDEEEGEEETPAVDCVELPVVELPVLEVTCG